MASSKLIRWPSSGFGRDDDARPMFGHPAPGVGDDVFEVRVTWAPVQRRLCKRRIGNEDRWVARASRFRTCGNGLARDLPSACDDFVDACALSCSEIVS